jgi:hypothetical protein
MDKPIMRSVVIQKRGRTMHLKSVMAMAVAICALSVQTSHAQYRPVGRAPANYNIRQPRNYNVPVLSPYLNLVGASSGGEFERQLFLRVLPETQLRSAATDLDKSVYSLRNDLQRQERQATSSQLGVSGHKTAFQNLGGYFPSR